MPAAYAVARSLETARRPAPLTRAGFLAGMSGILGANQRILYVPNGTDTTTSVESSTVGRTFTWDGDISSRVSRLGGAFVQSFNGTSQYGECPDAADLSFGNGTADSAFTVLAFAAPSAITGEHSLVNHWNNGVASWRFAIDTGGLVRLYLYDNSLGVSPNARTAANGAVVGAWRLLSATYTAATGGATAANDMSIYVNGRDATALRTNAGTYVAMENVASTGAIGSRDSHVNAFLAGSVGMVALTQKALTAAEHAQAWSLCRRLFRRPPP